MITIQVQAPFATFRKSFARSFAETYPVAPPATVYGMLLSLAGERFRQEHEGVRLAFAYRSVPRIATTLRKLSRYKYGVPGKQVQLGHAPDYIQTACGLDFLCWVDSSDESRQENRLEERITLAIEHPERVTRYGVLSLGLSDDLADVRLCEESPGDWHALLPRSDGPLDLPVWVSHVGAIGTYWNRYELSESGPLTEFPSEDHWTRMIRSHGDAREHA